MSTKPSDLATADGQKKLQGGKNPPGAAKNSPGGGKKSGEQKKKKKKKKVDVKTGVYESSIGGGKLTPGGAAHCLVSPLHYPLRYSVIVKNWPGNIASNVRHVAEDVNFTQHLKLYK